MGFELVLLIPINRKAIGHANHCIIHLTKTNAAYHVLRQFKSSKRDLLASWLAVHTSYYYFLKSSKATVSERTEEGHFFS